MKILTKVSLAAVAAVIATSPALAQHEGHGAMGDSAAVAAIVTKFHEALASADSLGALALLSDDVVILESGGAESLAQYRSNHLQADIRYERAVKITRGPIRVKIQGDVAWTSATSSATGEMNGRAINSQSAELMVMVRSGGQWKIAAIHWSSRR